MLTTTTLYDLCSVPILISLYSLCIVCDSNTECSEEKERMPCQNNTMQWCNTLALTYCNRFVLVIGFGTNWLHVFMASCHPCHILKNHFYLWRMWGYRSLIICPPPPKKKSNHFSIGKLWIFLTRHIRKHHQALIYIFLHYCFKNKYFKTLTVCNDLSVRSPEQWNNRWLYLLVIACSWMVKPSGASRVPLLDQDSCQDFVPVFPSLLSNCLNERGGWVHYPQKTRSQF